jgi:hypothetical protein
MLTQMENKQDSQVEKWRQRFSTCPRKQKKASVNPIVAVPWMCRPDRRSLKNIISSLAEK